MSYEALSTPAAIAPAASRPVRAPSAASGVASLTAALEPGEKVLWWDQPSPDRYAASERSAFVWLSLAGVVGLAVGVQQGLLQPLFDGTASTWYWIEALGFGCGIVVVMGLLPLIGWRLHHARARRLVYAITDRRILIIGDGRNPHDLAGMPSTSWFIRRGEDGLDTLVFRATPRDRIQLDTSEPEIAFYGVRDIDRVAELAQRTAYVRAGRFPR